MAESAGDLDVIVIGAGAAGISAAVNLAKTGLKVAMLEARERIGGRIFTVIDAAHQFPVELGAEFIHGRPAEIWKPLTARKIAITEVKGDNWCVEDGRLEACDFFSSVDEILGKLDDSNRDESFLEFLRRYSGTKEKTPQQLRAEKWATSYVSGFNAADPAVVGVHWLVQEMRADEKIDGERAFRAQHGYADLIDIFQQQLRENEIPVRKSTVVQSIKWERGRVEVSANSPRGVLNLSASRILITVPLGVLQARADETGAIRFLPELPPEKQNAIRNTMMGKVIRITLRFRERFWAALPGSAGAKRKTMNDMSFLFSQDEWFPTWWTTMPDRSPFITGWAPFHCAERLSGRGESFVVEHALATLHRLLGIREQELERSLEHGYMHDWQSDPFTRGAYSYGKAGEEKAPETLAKPLDGTLFFAGEATDVSGHNGTVHGAIASGCRAAAEIVKCVGSH
jgi:monoamine oxidase